MPSPPFRPISLDALRGFEASARQLSFTLAAAELKLTQSAISRQVAGLEDQIGAALFVRKTRALELTDAGAQLLRAVQSGLAAIDACVDELRGHADDARVSITTYPSFASLWLAPRLVRFQQGAPEVSVRIDSTDALVDLPATGIDLAVRSLRLDRAPPDAELLAAEETTAAGSPHLLRQRPALTDPAELLGFPLLDHDASKTRSAVATWAGWLEFAGVSTQALRPRMTFGHIDQQVQAALRGDGLIIARAPFLSDLIAGGMLEAPFPGLRAPTGMGLFLISHPNRKRRPATQALAQFIRDEFAALSPRP